jgi:hypothetical protein
MRKTMKDDAWIVQQFLNERGARELSGHGATLGAFERIRDRLETAERGQKEALAQMCKTARELGEAQGKLAASELPGVVDGWRERAEAAESRVSALTEALKKAREGLEPFAEVAEHDIGDSEADNDWFRPMNPKYARAPLLCVGVLRRTPAIISAIDAALKGE